MDRTEANKLKMVAFSTDFIPVVRANCAPMQRDIFLIKLTINMQINVAKFAWTTEKVVSKRVSFPFP